MFDYSVLHWTTFLTAAVLLNLSPGPDIAFSIVKWAGAAYLIWLGISALRSRGGSFVSSDIETSPRFIPVYKQGFALAFVWTAALAQYLWHLVFGWHWKNGRIL